MSSERPTSALPPAKAGATGNGANRQEVLPETSASTTSGPTPLASELLFGAAREVQISHRGVLYRLKQTSLGKLILTK